MDRSKENILNPIIWLSAIHIVGIWFMRSELILEFFIPVIPLLLIICFCVLIYYQRHWNMNAILFLFLTFLAGFFIHVIGVNTKYPFGKYTYENSIMGPKLFNTPLLLGLYWLVLIYCIGILLKNLNFTLFQKSLLGALMAVLYDITLEPLAKKNSMWWWLTREDPLSKYNPVPLQNYLSWFVFAFLMLLYFFNAKAKLRNSMAPAVFIIMFLFLVALHIFP